MGKEFVYDVLVILDGENGWFQGYVPEESMQYIQAVGFNNAEQVILRETDDCPLPESLKRGETIITDLWVRMEHGKEYYLN